MWKAKNHEGLKDHYRLVTGEIPEIYNQIKGGINYG